MPHPAKKGQKRGASSLVEVSEQITPAVKRAPVLSPVKERAAKRHGLASEEDCQALATGCILTRAAMALRPAAPRLGVLPCRVAERRKIATHLRSGVQQGGSAQVLYVSGMPGTGKTAILLEVLGQLRFESPFHLVHVNAMRLSSPSQVFKEIADQLLPEKTSISLARENLGQYFLEREEEDAVVVLLIDEVDCLVTNNQAVLYSVFDWLGMPRARLVLAAISNTMDLPERLLPRVASRFHIERVDFAPYNKSQIYEILCSRLKLHDAVDAFSDVALRLCGARVAGASGDIRKALQVCRRAVERLAQSECPGNAVSVADLEAAEKELVFANPVAQAIAGLSAFTRRFLAAVVIELRRKETGTVSFRRTSSRFHKLLAVLAVDDARCCNDGGDQIVSFEDMQSAQDLMRRLEALSILTRVRYAVSSSSSSQAVASSDHFAISLRSLDVEDLASALLKVEDDPILRDLIDGGRPGYQPSTTYRLID